MDTPKIFDSELRFCEILWQHEPVKSSELVRLCADELGWKKSTTYTVIKRLTERGVAGCAEFREPRLCGQEFSREPAGVPVGVYRKQAAHPAGGGRAAADDRQVRGGAPWISCSTRYWSFRGRPG